MKKLGFVMCFLLLFFSCTEDEKTLKEGNWLVELQVMDHQKLPFNLKLIKETNTSYSAEIYNGDEVIHTNEIDIVDNTIIIRLPVFEGYLKGTFDDSTIKGDFIKESLDRVVPFIATYGKTNRFEIANEAKTSVSGIWETKFSPNTKDAYIGKGIFVQNNTSVHGTFRTTTGDYRYLEGVLDGDSLKLSAFDGAHAFLFKAKVNDSLLEGTFYSGNHFKEPFTAIRNEVFELPDEDALTYLKEGYDKFDFSFPNEEGKMLSLSDEIFKDKVVIIQVMGTWCPNCLDETKFLVDFLKNNRKLELEVVALSFEYAKTEEDAYKSINRLKKRVGINYPVLLAQYGTADKEEAQKKLPMLNHVLSYPTTIFIDKQGVVRKIKTGFNGPATGEKYAEFKTEFTTLVTELAHE
ncbi:peroxiredoxin family protein [Cellulophaga sp. Z1A5H]|uniref:peroxiredoxin family protein n=1 Tax=Cellulophaga sp. Z1A5H TaxID=2687291 RepID=UPI0013FDAD4C|nr:TlpA disulfide reductase family protein [Cellulophaga sp. Z1A5H]